MKQSRFRKSKAAGAFQVMNLSIPVMKAITRRGYKLPTPIQRKTIPIIMEGRDVVAMARTGSGKTAAFLVPMFEKLRRSEVGGARALILAPTRELVLQTLKFTKELGKFTDLKHIAVLGGERMEDQFESLHGNPDIIIATPGRLLHILVEMDKKLERIEYLVFDEADRLFEMGFREQLYEILNRIPEARQTVMFSATLPKQLMEFAKAGLVDPTLIRLDTESKLSPALKTHYLYCRPDDKLPLLLHVLRHLVLSDQQTIVFSATKHHVEFLNMILTRAGFCPCYIYSSLDPTARKLSISKFQKKQSHILLVTDLAARGIDIPLLSNAINFNFPPKPKLFIHRVGRVARAGMSGNAYSFVSSDELPYLIELHLFLSKQLHFSTSSATGSSGSTGDGCLGRVPQNIIDEELETMSRWQDIALELSSMKRVCENAQKQYIKCCPVPSGEAVKKAKAVEADLPLTTTYHSLFSDKAKELEASDLLNQLKAYKAKSTIFEIGGSSSRSRVKGTSSSSSSKIIPPGSAEVMSRKRRKDDRLIAAAAAAANRRKMSVSPSLEAAKADDAEASDDANHLNADVKKKIGEEDNFDDDIRDNLDLGSFVEILPPPPSASAQYLSFTSTDRVKKKRSRLPVRQDEFFVAYKPKDFYSERGLEVRNSFDVQAEEAILDFTGDDDRELRDKRKQVRWDRKRKRFVNEAAASSGDGKNHKKIKTESGAYISASYKSNLYKDWLKKSKADEQQQQYEEGEDDDNPEYSTSRGTNSKFTNQRQRGESSMMRRNNQLHETHRKGGRKGIGLKSRDEIVSARKKKLKKQNRAASSRRGKAGGSSRSSRGGRNKHGSSSNRKRR